jgi:hypothetical protein
MLAWVGLKVIKAVAKKIIGKIGANVELPAEKLKQITDEMVSNVAKETGSGKMLLLSTFLKIDMDKKIDSGEIKTISALEKAMEEYLNTNESFNTNTVDSDTESKIDEARSIKKIEKEYSQTVADMKMTVDKWKAAEEGELKTSLLDKLKGLTTKKRQLEMEMDDAVSLKDIDAELVASESITLSKAEKWMQLSEKLNRQLNEDLRTELKKYIKANQKELNSLADADNWDAIHNMLRTDFNAEEGSKEEDNLFTTFNFVF